MSNDIQKTTDEIFAKDDQARELRHFIARCLLTKVKVPFLKIFLPHVIL